MGGAKEEEGAAEGDGAKGGVLPSLTSAAYRSLRELANREPRAELGAGQSKKEGTG